MQISNGQNVGRHRFGFFFLKMYTFFFSRLAENFVTQRVRRDCVFEKKRALGFEKNTRKKIRARPI